MRKHIRELTAAERRQIRQLVKQCANYDCLTQKIYVFYSFITNYPSNWGRFKETESTGWNLYEFAIKSYNQENLDKIKSMIDEFVLYVISELEKYVE